MKFKPFENKIWLASPKMHGDEQKYVKEAFDANWVSTVGENLNQFEVGICKYIGVKNAVALVSGTAALHLAIKLADVKQGDKVFCSDMTFVATVNPVIYEKAEPIFIDSEYETWNMNPKALKKAFEKFPDVSVVVVANLYGVPAKLDEIKAICDKYGAILIEDAAESLGATLNGQQTGSFGAYNVVSFNGNKIITTSGGGVLLTNDNEAANYARKLSTQAREPAPWYQHEYVGYNYRMSNILAGIGRGQLLYLDEHINRKKTIYNRYKNAFEDLPVVMNPFLDSMKPNYWLSCFLIDESCTTTPEDICITLEKCNVEARPIWKPMHMQPVYANCDFISLDGKDVGKDIFTRGLCLPSDINMTEKQQERIIKIISACFE
ncbi:MAG: aminotransferase class I/II-fold pyridoxal phosphate-dependent enzyme [Ruminococcaceae bacterium]|nr:aminotransferase class I/II-fold pyridoxal phosphate-dependent enzyme [Oscillospiraceae bacterium]